MDPGQFFLKEEVERRALIANLRKAWHPTAATLPWTATLRPFAEYALAQCQRVALYTPCGRLWADAKRTSPALEVPPCLFPPDLIHLRVTACAGAGVSSTAWRGWFWGIPFVAKIAHSQHSPTIAREWEAIAGCIPRCSGDARLPVPRYYGLFESAFGPVMIMSDNGVPVSSFTGGAKSDLR